MKDEAKEQHDVVAEYFEEDQSGQEQTDTPLDNNGEMTELPKLVELWEAQTYERAGTLEALSIGLPKFMFTFDTEGAIARIFLKDGAL